MSATAGRTSRFPLDPLCACARHRRGRHRLLPAALRLARRQRSRRYRASRAAPSDLAYLRARLSSGEAFDWYYADAADRAAQTRLPITDGAYGKPWIFRPKDLVGWW